MGPSMTGFLLDELRRARMRRGLTQEELGKLINYSNSQVSGVETGTRQLTRHYVAAVDTALETGGLFTRMLQRVAEFDTEPPWLREWVAVERRATEFRWYEVAWVPGLLQTEAYARAVFSSDVLLGADEVETRVTARLDRQQVLARDNPPHVAAVIDEGVLRRAVGGSAVMREQVFHLVRLNTDNRRVRIQVVPSSVGAYPGLDGPFIILRFDEGTEAAILENCLEGQKLARPDDLVVVMGQWESILTEALPPGQSTELMTEIAKSWK
jgi:transcriptional regulator with XRE-family HTH domain